MLGRDELSRAVRLLDATSDAGNDLPTILEFLEVDSRGAVYVAEQRALRVAMLRSGVNPIELRALTARGAAFVPKLTERENAMIPIYAGLWLDGLAAGVKALRGAG